MLSCETPGVSMARSIQRREATGRSWICSLVTLVAIVDAQDKAIRQLARSTFELPAAPEPMTPLLTLLPVAPILHWH